MKQTTITEQIFGNKIVENAGNYLWNYNWL